MRTLLLIILFISCASSTKFQKKYKGEGYVDGKIDGINFTDFYANAHTKLKNAITYAEYRAREVCLPQKTYYLGIQDFSNIRKVIRTSGTTSTPYFSAGNYSYRRGTSFGVGFGTYSSESWEDKEVYPRPRILYMCGDSFHAPSGEFREVGPQVYKDTLGALLVEKSDPLSPLQKGDIILRVAKDRVEKLFDFYYRFQLRGVEQVEILRDGERKILQITSQDITEKVAEFNREVRLKMCEINKEFCSKKD